MTPLSPAAFADALGDVSPPVQARLSTYCALLTKWQRAINLVSATSLEDPWRRHFLDSAQLVHHMGAADSYADLGSGAGFPGLVVAIMTGRPVTLVESDQRKATFLREVARETNVEATVVSERIEHCVPLNADVVSARALAPLSRLLPWVHRHLAPHGRAILLKGADVDEELTGCSKKWTMEITKAQSLSDASGCILLLEKLEPIDVG